MLTSPSYGLDDVWRAQFIFAIGALFGLLPVGLIKLAAFLATLKLAVAVICAIYVVMRLRAFARGQADSEILEAGLILVVLISILAVGPAVWSQNAELVREGAIQLLLAAIATGLCLVERKCGQAAENPPPAAIEFAATPRGAPWFSPFR